MSVYLCIEICLSLKLYVCVCVCVYVQIPKNRKRTHQGEALTKANEQKLSPHFFFSFWSQKFLKII